MALGCSRTHWELGSWPQGRLLGPYRLGRVRVRSLPWGSMEAVGADDAGGGSVNPILELGWSPIKAASDLGHFPVKGK